MRFTDLPIIERITRFIARIIGGTGTLSATLTADRTWTMPNKSGTVAMIDDIAGGSGTVTSVALSGGTTGLTASGGPITGAGTITLAGTLAIANGGTGATAQQAAINALTGTQTANRVLRSDGVNATLSQVALATDVVGNLPVANLGGGTGASATTYWRGDGTWATPAGGGGLTLADWNYLRGDVSTDGSTRFGSLTSGTITFQKRIAGMWVDIGVMQ